jgi:hypothetical protein
MTAKTSSATKKKTAKTAQAGKTAKTGSRKAKASWADVMKQALQKKQPAGGFPDQPKPRDSVVQKVKKNAY